VTHRPWTNGTLVGFDLETTGLDREVEEPVSYAFITWDRGELVDVEEGYVQPTRAISEGAAAVHGLTEATLASLGAVEHDEGMRAIERRLAKESAQHVPIVGANLAYDLTMVDRTLWRLAEPSSLASAHWRGPALDVLVIDRALDQDFAARPGRRLAELCEHYGVTTAMHTASGDASAAVQIVLAQAARFPELAAATLDELDARQRTWHREWCDAFAARRVAKGQDRLDPGESAWPYLERATLF